MPIHIGYATYRGTFYDNICTNDGYIRLIGNDTCNFTILLDHPRLFIFLVDYDMFIIDCIRQTLFTKNAMQYLVDTLLISLHRDLLIKINLIILIPKRVFTLVLDLFKRLRDSNIVQIQ